MAVIAHTPGTPEFAWAIVADSLLLVATALLLIAPRWGPPAVRPWRFRLFGIGAAVLASLIALAGKTLEVWPGNPLFPSGHTAYTVTIAVFLVRLDRRWLAWALALGTLMGVALVLAHYHVPVDVAGGILVGLTVGLPLARAAVRRAPGPPETVVAAPSRHREA